MTNAFNLQGPSTLLKAMGRIKSPTQVRKDAQRVNPQSDSAKATPEAFLRSQQIRRGGR